MNIHSYLVEKQDTCVTMRLSDAEVMYYLDMGYRIKRRIPLKENNLYVTFGCRAGEMNQLNEIDLPGDCDSEDELAILAEDVIGEWTRKDYGIPYDEFIETKLIERFPPKKN